MSHCSWRRILSACACAAIPGSLYAVDSVVLINQSNAATGFPIVISQPGSYRLSGDITVSGPNSTAIEITASFVTLDLNGFSILGPTVCSGTPPTCAPKGSGIGIATGANVQAARVFNGTVHGMGGDGINVAGTIEGVAADGNGGVGLVATGSVIESVASRNGLAGIFASMVRDSIAIRNGLQGMLIGFSAATPPGVASGNTALLNGGIGIDAVTSTLLNNTAQSNGGAGIVATCPSSIVGNTSVGNSGVGISAPSNQTMACILSDNATDK
jgi:hypothetical protein